MSICDLANKAFDLTLILLIIVVLTLLLSQPEVVEFLTQRPPEEPQEAPPEEEAPAEPEEPAEVPPEEPFINYSVTYSEMEQGLFKLVNEVRVANGLEELVWNEKVAAVAREHSENIAIENEPLTERDLLCYVPLLHHEGFDFGLYHGDRLENREVYYFETAGENMFLASKWKSRTTHEVFDIECPENGDRPTGPQAVEVELEKRLEYVKTLPRVEWSFVGSSQEEIQQSIVDGWLESAGHKSNILNSNYTESGIGIAASNDFYVVTQLFIKRVYCGYRGGTCCHEEGYEPYCYLPLDCIDDVCVKTTY